MRVHGCASHVGGELCQCEPSFEKCWCWCQHQHQDGSSCSWLESSRRRLKMELTTLTLTVASEAAMQPPPFIHSGSLVEPEGEPSGRTHDGLDAV